MSHPEFPAFEADPITPTLAIELFISILQRTEVQRGYTSRSAFPGGLRSGSGGAPQSPSADGCRAGKGDGTKLADSMNEQELLTAEGSIPQTGPVGPAGTELSDTLPWKHSQSQLRGSWFSGPKTQPGTCSKHRLLGSRRFLFG